MSRPWRFGRVSFIGCSNVMGNVTESLPAESDGIGRRGASGGNAQQQELTEIQHQLRVGPKRKIIYWP